MGDVLVLCYHAVSPTWDSRLSVTPDLLKRQLASLVRHGFRGATFADAIARPPAARTLAVTFDDAYRSVFDVAFPILERLGLPGTVFVPTQFAGRDEPMAWPGIDDWRGEVHEHELYPLGWQQLGALAEAGWEIGSHTVSHPRLTEVGDDQLVTELGESKAACEAALEIACVSIAYPYGAVDPRVVRATDEAGYTFGAALPPAFHVPRPLEWPRVGVYNGDSAWRFRLKSSRPGRAVRSSPAGERAAGLFRR